MLAFLGLPKNYVSTPKAKRAGSEPAVGHVFYEERGEGLTLRRASLPACGMFPALGLKQKRHSEVECSVESNRPPCFVLGTYQGEPWP